MQNFKKGPRMSKRFLAIFFVAAVSQPAHSMQKFAAALQSVAKSSHKVAPRPFDQWFAAMGKAYRPDWYQTFAQQGLTPPSPLTEKKFLATVEKFITRSQHNFTTATAWLNNSLNKHSPQAVLVQKILTTAPCTLFIYADPHADVATLLVSLKQLQNRGLFARDGSYKLTRKDAFLIFLGDYTDNGGYDFETLYTLLKLKIANPDNVTLIRGNHEELPQDLTNRHIGKGIFAALRAKLPTWNWTKFRHKLLEVYSYFPHAVYFGSGAEGGPASYALFCHAGPELGYDPRALLSDPRARLMHAMPLHEIKDQRIANAEAVKRLISTQATFAYAPDSVVRAAPLGFTWNGFLAFSGQPTGYSGTSNGVSFGKEFTQALLDLHSTAQATVNYIIHGHAHSFIFDKKSKTYSLDAPMTRSILGLTRNGNFFDNGHNGVSILWGKHAWDGTLWDGAVCLPMLPPDISYQKELNARDRQIFNYGTEMQVTTTVDPSEPWSLQVNRTSLEKMSELLGKEIR